MKVNKLIAVSLFGVALCFGNGSSMDTREPNPNQQNEALHPIKKVNVNGKECKYNALVSAAAGLLQIHMSVFDIRCMPHNEIKQMLESVAVDLGYQQSDHSIENFISDFVGNFIEKSDQDSEAVAILEKYCRSENSNSAKDAH